MTDPQNVVVQLCVQGMQAETEGRDAQARDLFLQAWDTAEDDYDACIAAHYLARHQPTPQETLHWNQECLNRADKVGGDRVRGFYASLHGNMARAHRDLGQIDQAREHFEAAAKHIDAVPAGPHQQWLRYRIAAGLRATTRPAPQQHEDPVSELLTQLCARTDLEALSLLLPPYMGSLGTPEDDERITTALRMLHAERRLPDEEQTALSHAIEVRSAAWAPRARFGGVEPICRVLTEHDCKIAPSTYYAHHKRLQAPSARTVRDAELKPLIQQVFEVNYRVYGARKVWRELHRQGHIVARCTVERLMRELGVTGAVREKKIITTIPDSSVERAPDLLDRKFVASAPNRCWAADFTHISTWSGVVYVAFVVDTFSRRIVGWAAALSKETRLVLDALDMALWQRDRVEHPHKAGQLIHHCDAGSQYTSFRLAEHLDAAGIAASIGSVGDAYDNALMESTIGLFKTELIKPRRPWKTLSQVELATAEWIDWYCHRRLHGEIGHIPPVEYETNYYSATAEPQVTTTI